MIVVVGRAQVREQYREIAVVAACRMQEASRREPGCIHYQLATDLSDPLRIHLFEIWENDDALAKHVNEAHVIEFIRTVNEVLDGEPEYQRFVVSDT